MKKGNLPQPGKDALIFESPYFQAPNDIFEVPGLDVYEKLIYLYLCRVGNSGNRIFPAYPDIAQKASCSPRKAQDSVGKLCTMRLIGKIKNPQGSHLSNTYQINVSYFIEVKQPRTEAQEKAITAHYTEKHPDAALGKIANMRGETILNDKGTTLAKPKPRQGKLKEDGDK